MNKEVKTEVIDLELDAVKPYWRNSRNIEEAVEIVKKSIKMYGYNQYIAIDDKNVIIAGHARYKALRELGIDTAKFIRVTGLTKDQVREYRIADNKANERAKWIFSELSQEIASLNAEVMADFFNDAELQELINRMPDTVADLNYDVDIMSKKDITGEDIEKKQEQMKDAYADIAAGKISEHITIMCPECTHEFQVRRLDILKRPE